MHVIDQYANLLADATTTSPQEVIEKAGRTCYKSEDRITSSSSRAFVRQLVKRGHGAMLEHAVAAFRIVTDRGVTHELVRHRVASYAQESTRYVNYGGGGKAMLVIRPVWLPGADFDNPESLVGPAKTWYNAMSQAERDYTLLLDQGWSPPAGAKRPPQLAQDGDRRHRQSPGMATHRRPALRPRCPPPNTGADEGDLNVPLHARPRGL